MAEQEVPCSIPAHLNLTGVSALRWKKYLTLAVQPGPAKSFIGTVWAIKQYPYLLET